MRCILKKNNFSSIHGNRIISSSLNMNNFNKRAEQNHIFRKYLKLLKSVMRWRKLFSKSRGFSFPPVIMFTQNTYILNCNKKITLFLDWRKRSILTLGIFFWWICLGLSSVLCILNSNEISCSSFHC